MIKHIFTAITAMFVAAISKCIKKQYRYPYNIILFCIILDHRPSRIGRRRRRRRRPVNYTAHTTVLF